MDYLLLVTMRICYIPLDSNLITLCKYCHLKAHDGAPTKLNKKIQKLLWDIK